MEKTVSTSSEKLTEALKLLEEAAREKKDELSGLLANKYSHLKGVIVDKEQDLKETWLAAKQRTTEALTRAGEISKAKAEEVARELDKNVHKNPWPYIGGVALGALLIGFIFGRASK